MPEGHTIRRQAKEFAAGFAGDKVVVSRRRAGSRRAPRCSTATSWCARRRPGKHLFLRFGNGRYLHVHLGLIRQVDRFGPPPAPEPVGAVRVRLEGPTALGGPARRRPPAS